MKARPPYRELILAEIEKLIPLVGISYEAAKQIMVLGKILREADDDQKSGIAAELRRVAGMLPSTGRDEAVMRHYLLSLVDALLA